MNRCAHSRCRGAAEALCGGDAEGGAFGCGKSFCLEHLSLALMADGATAHLCDDCIESWTSWAERQWELQAKFLYCLVVAGKSARHANQAVESLLHNVVNNELPLDMLRRLAEQKELLAALQTSRTGNYTKLMKAIADWDESALDLEAVTVADLEAIHGVGPKTARFFVVWTRPKERVAVLDVHVLRWLQERGYATPKTTPASKAAYQKLEQVFLEEADRRKLTPRQLDEQIWRAGSGAENRIPDFLLHRS